MRQAYLAIIRPKPSALDARFLRYVLVSHDYPKILSLMNAPWSFIHAAKTQPEVSDYLGQMADDAAFPAGRPEIIGAWKVAVPDQAKNLDAFQYICAPLFERADDKRNESRTLTTMREALLPNLLSGELSVNELSPNSAFAP